MLTVILILACVALAYANGANDNFKGVATLYGSATASYRSALIWATTATLMGSLFSIALSHGLVQAFSGKGLLPDALITPQLLGSVGLAAAITILLATFLGMPTSTTHAMMGALLGVGLMAAPSDVGWTTLRGNFALPLLLSPLLAIGLTSIAYWALHRTRRSLGIERQTCICVGRQAPQPVTLLSHGQAALRSQPGAPLITVDSTTRCVQRYAGGFVGVEAQGAVHVTHYMSAGAVCFARAVNDTPKIAALLLATHALPGKHAATMGLLLVTAAVVTGGLLQSRKVARTMSLRITELSGGQGLTANLITAAVVLGASRFGMPVSTTHVSCGSIFGIGLVNGHRNWKTVLAIFAAWVTTLPLALVLGASFYWLINPTP